MDFNKHAELGHSNMINFTDFYNHTFLLSTIVAIELCIFIFCLTLYLRRFARDYFMSYCYSVIIILSFFSALIQILLLLGTPYLLPMFEIVAFIISIYLSSNSTHLFTNRKTEDKYFYLQYIPVVFIVMIMLIQAVVLIPLNHDCLTYNIARTSLMLNENKLFIDNYNSIRQVMYNPGFDVLNILFSRFRSDYYLGFFNFLLFIAVVSSILSILDQLKVKRKYWILSVSALLTMDSLILQATSAKNDVILIACEMVIFSSILSLQNNKSKYFKLSMIMLSAVFGSISKLYFLAICVPLVLFILNYWNMFSFKKYVSEKKELLASSIISVLAFCQVLLFILFSYNNYKTFGGVLGDPTFVSQQKNHDGLVGMLSNMARYLFTMPAFSSQYYKNIIIFLHDKVLNLGIVGTNISFAEKYDMTLSHHEDLAGVGCLFFLLFCLAPLLFVMLKGKFERLLIVTSFILFTSICYSLAWNPWWVRFFPFVFVPLAPIVSIIADKQNIKFLVIPVSILFCASAFMTFKDDVIKNYRNISFAITNRDELYNMCNIYVFNNTSLFKEISGNALIFAKENDPTYQYFVLMKNASIKVLSSDKCCNGLSSCELKKYIANNNISTVIDLGCACGNLDSYKTIFESQNDFSKIRILSAAHS